MGLRYDREEAVERKPYYSNADSSLRRSLQSAQIILPVLQAQDTEEYTGAYTEYSEEPYTPGVTSVAIIRGRHTKLDKLQWANTSTNDWSYTIAVNGYTMQTGTGSGSSPLQDVTFTKFDGSIIEPTDIITLTVTRTAGVGNTDPHLKIKGWNI